PLLLVTTTDWSNSYVDKLQLIATLPMTFNKPEQMANDKRTRVRSSWFGSFRILPLRPDRKLSPTRLARFISVATKCNQLVR
ncbi:MAG: hypothetical protein VYA12_05115, partial [Pseudomonadota bacterium]|nr:hypothetical protein [Pseudomonadota bacterium]